MLTRIPPDYEVREQFHSEQNHVKIIHVGAGVSGLLTAYKARKYLKDYELVCYEKNPTIGGTWWENRYPGCACDVPSHSYTLTFEPNPEWSGFYAFGSEIQAYFQKFYEKYELQPYMKFDTKVLSAVWHEDKGEWKVELEKGGEKFTDWCNVLINGSGPINKWKWPVIEGIETYKGTLAHTANWSSNIDWKGKRVAVIGSGSSSVQVVPQLAEGCESLTVFARNSTWIAPQMGSQDVKILPPDSEQTSKPAAAGKHQYTEEEKEKMRTDPEAFLKYRKEVDGALQKGFSVFLRGSDLNVMAKKGMAEMIRARIGPGHEDLKEKFIPKWSPGCRRMTPGEGYLEALTKDHVSVISDEIVRFTENGLVTADGKDFEFDIIACATGFNVAFAPHFKMVGVDGVVLQEEWAEYPNIYLSVASPKFPNYFTVGGPTGNWGQGCVLVSHEVQVEYAMQCCVKIAEENLHSLEVCQSPTTQYLLHSYTWHNAKSVWAEDCRSWYKDNKPNGRIQLWCGSMMHLLKTLRTPRWEDYRIKRRDANMWTFLGNGRIELEVEGEKGKEVDWAPYIRNADVPWSLDL
ncbi:hypothetical protein HO173_011622 [Letharia columbiana]|uniref:FAD/NAD(P)-binding domain-containing protein n=1 Tax=Letharia columbiana TaxID=112416 RepID=A0A8H6CSD4_9LECA|nr:uncharacterized protein HO173_011622 [Letharia columbiana]KAF6228775.1 hypothetical protein HO173_011622 [Letharia columbiana]